MRQKIERPSFFWLLLELVQSLATIVKVSICNTEKISNSIEEREVRKKNTIEEGEVRRKNNIEEREVRKYNNIEEG